MNTLEHLPGWTKGLVPLIAIAVVFVRCRRRPELREQFGLRAPSFAGVAVGVALVIAYMFVTDYLMAWRGPWDWQLWLKATWISNGLRILAVVFLGPIAEELIFRGILQYRLARHLPNAAAVFLIAAVWAAGHWNYSYEVRGLFFGLGSLLGFARWKTNSVWVPISMHCVWNGYAVW